MTITGKQLANAVQIMKLVFQGRGISERYSVNDVVALAPQVAALFYADDPHEKVRNLSRIILTQKIVETMVTIRVECS